LPDYADALRYAAYAAFAAAALSDAFAPCYRHADYIHANAHSTYAIAYAARLRCRFTAMPPARRVAYVYATAQTTDTLSTRRGLIAYALR